MTVEQWLYQWLQIYVKGTKKPKTYSCYLDTVHRIKAYWPEISGWDLERPKELEIQQFINRMAEHFAKSTLNDIRVVFKQAYNAAIRNGLCEESPAEELRLPASAKIKEVQALTVEEQKRLECAADKDVLGHIVHFFLFTGLRAGELMRLKWEDYDVKEKTLIIRESKTTAGERIMPLIPESDEIIQLQPHINAFIFNSTIRQPITPMVLKRLYLRMREATGIQSITNHVYRHCFATRMVENGSDYKALAKLMGHTEASFTIKQYVRTEIEFLRNQVAFAKRRPEEPQKEVQSEYATILNEVMKVHERLDLLATQIGHAC